MGNFKLDLSKIEDAISFNNNSLSEEIIKICEETIKVGSKVEVGREITDSSNIDSFEKCCTINNFDELASFKKKLLNKQPICS